MSNNKNGYELELKFKDWIIRKSGGDNLCIVNWSWLSIESKSSEFDFWAKDNHHEYYFDVVGYYQFRDSYRLITAHKSWKLKIDWLKVYGIRTSMFRELAGGYLAFTFDNGNSWRFYKIHIKLPIGDLLLTKERMKNVLTAGWLFGRYGYNMAELKEDARFFAEDEAEIEGIKDKAKIEAIYKDNIKEFIAYNKI